MSRTALDTLIVGAEVLTAVGRRRCDVGVADGLIVALAPSVTETATETIDATGALLVPGMIDAHVHFNEPGRTDWEGAASGSRALAGGGGTLFFDMPLNSSPCTVDADAFDAKRAALEIGRAHV